MLNVSTFIGDTVVYLANDCVYYNVCEEVLDNCSYENKIMLYANKKKTNIANWRHLRLISVEAPPAIHKCSQHEIELATVFALHNFII